MELSEGTDSKVSLKFTELTDLCVQVKDRKSDHCELIRLLFLANGNTIFNNVYAVYPLDAK